MKVASLVYWAVSKAEIIWKQKKNFKRPKYLEYHGNKNLQNALVWQEKCCKRPKYHGNKN
jgi:hypothetical protein